MSQILSCPLLWVLHGLCFCIRKRNPCETESWESKTWLDNEEPSLGWTGVFYPGEPSFGGFRQEDNHTFQRKVNREMLNVFARNTAICLIYNIKILKSTAAREIRKSQIKSFRRPFFEAQKICIVFSHYIVFRGYFLAQREKKDERRVFSLVGAVEVADVFPVREPAHLDQDSTHSLFSCSLNWGWIKAFSIATCFY